jgi:hypothetical protein
MCLCVQRYAIVSNKTIHLQGMPKPGTNLEVEMMQNGAPRSVRVAESRADGQWLLSGGSNGSFYDAWLGYHREWKDAAEECIRVLSGPWEFTRTHVRCGGHAAIVCSRDASVALTNSSVGGIGKGMMSYIRGGAGKRRSKKEAGGAAEGCWSQPASDGVRLGGNSSCYMYGCTVEQTGLFKGAGVNVRQGARAKIEWCHLANNKYYAVAVEGDAWAEVGESLFQSNYWSCLAAQP